MTTPNSDTYQTALNDLGEILRKYRKAAGATVWSLSPLCSGGYVSQFERGRNMPRLEIVEEYVKRFNADQSRLGPAYARAESLKPSRKKVAKDQRLKRIDNQELEISRHLHTAGFHWELIDRTSTYSGPCLREVDITRTMRAEIDGIKENIYRFRLNSDPESVEVIAISGCTIGSSSFSGGVLKIRLDLPSALHKGESHAHSIKIRTNTTIASETFIKLTNPAGIFTKRSIIKASFTKHPPQMWAHRSSTHLAPLSDFIIGKPVHVDNASGLHTAEFNDILPGTSYGLAWK